MNAAKLTANMTTIVVRWKGLACVLIRRAPSASFRSAQIRHRRPAPLASRSRRSAAPQTGRARPGRQSPQTLRAGRRAAFQTARSPARCSTVAAGRGGAVRDQGQQAGGQQQQQQDPDDRPGGRKRFEHRRELVPQPVQKITPPLRHFGWFGWLAGRELNILFGAHRLPGGVKRSAHVTCPALRYFDHRQSVAESPSRGKQEDRCPVALYRR